MELIEKAKIMCKTAHNAVGQKRKYTNEPYWVHPFEVAHIVSEFTSCEDVIAAAYLHDVIEDTKITHSDIWDILNSSVADYVSEVTDISKDSDGNREKRKKIDAHHLLEATQGGLKIKMADIISNTRSIAAYDIDFSKVYIKEKIYLLKLIQENKINFANGCELFLRAKESVLSVSNLLGINWDDIQVDGDL